MALSDPQISDYEKRRLQNLADNKRILAELGIINPYQRLSVSKRDLSFNRPSTKAIQRRKSILSEKTNGQEFSNLPQAKRRKSARIRGIAADESHSLSDCDDSSENSDDKDYKNVHSSHENIYGHIDGVPVGFWWQTRMECSAAGVHRPTVAGIHGHSVNGAYSIALSGGYEDNIDLGECFTYTGEGGRDLKGTKANPKNLRTAPQSKDQTLTRGNLALSQSVKTGNPVRVIRGYMLPSVFAPETGYRYDGLYTVKKCWFATGASGYGVWKFALQRCENQDPLPFEVTQSDENSNPEENEQTKENYGQQNKANNHKTDETAM